ncbi:hypothetical protein ACQ4M4_03870 [Leptolyngbya sp. AN02str]
MKREVNRVVKTGKRLMSAKLTTTERQQIGQNKAASLQLYAAIAVGTWLGFAWLPAQLNLSIGPYTPTLGLSSAALAQSYVRNVDEVTTLVYEQFPELLEAPNEQQATDQNLRATFIYRMVRYHILRARSPIHRLDWKLTLADYLGINETILPEYYDRIGNYTVEDLEQDQAAIAALSRPQREALITTLVTIYNPTTSEQLSSPRPAAPTSDPLQSTEQPPPSSSPLPPGMGSTQVLPQEPRPGDAQLLLP